MGIEDCLKEAGEAFEGNKRLFESLLPGDIERYRGQMVAVCGGNIYSCAPKDYLHMIGGLRGKGADPSSIFVRYVPKSDDPLILNK